jgi:plasmid stabilization system protein ParE
MLKVTFQIDARREFLDAQDYYDSEQPGLGQEFVIAIQDECVKIAKKPDVWSLVYGGIRKYHVARFPYLIYYSIRSEDIYILAVAHCSRNPLYWINRIDS